MLRLSVNRPMKNISAHNRTNNSAALAELLAHIATKRVVVMALGHYPKGTGMESVKFFLRHGAKVLVTDLEEADRRREQVRVIENYYAALRAKGKRVFRPTFVFGRHREEDIRGADLVIQGPAVPAFSPYLAVAEKLGIPITNDWGIFLALKDNPIIGVTGTRGKSTTTTLLFDMIRREDKRVLAAGNLGCSPLHFIDTIKPGVPVVTELSSWLLNHFPAASRGLKIAIITNMFPDHLNKYRSMDEYVADKEAIFLRQTADDVAILNRDNVITRSMGARVRARRFWVSLKEFRDENGIFPRQSKLIFRNKGKEQVLGNIADIRILGTHNLANVMAAAAAARLYGISVRNISAAIRAFKGLPDRLELITTIKGVDCYNDTTATSPDGVIAALRALDPEKKKRIVLIAGGVDKKLQYEELAKTIPQHVKHLVLLPGTGTDRLVYLLQKRRFGRMDEPVRTMEEAVAAAWGHAMRGDIILLSPGGASFNLFRNEFDRGKEFVKAVKMLYNRRAR